MHPDAAKIEALAQAPIHRTNGQAQTEPDPIVLVNLLSTIETVLLRHVTLPDPALATLVASWIALTYSYKQFRCCGYLALRSPTPRCGKSLLLRIVALYASGNPPITVTPSAATFFRSKRRVHVLDEVDRLRNADKETYGEILSILNCGFERGGFVERVERSQGGFEVRQYDVFGPKALAGIESLADALQDRAFLIQMQRTTKRMPRFNIRKLEEEAATIRQQLAEWAALHGQDLKEAYDELPHELPDLAGYDDRFQDIAEPLVVLASLADAERPEGPKVLARLLESLEHVAGHREGSTRERDLLALLDMLKEQLIGHTELFIPSSELLELCGKREELENLETPRKLAGFLRHFELYPTSDGKLRGYLVRETWIKEWEARYG